VVSPAIGLLSSSSYIRKSFDGYDAQRRASVAKALSDLACPLAHGENLECSRPTRQDLLLLSTYNTAIRQVLRGRTDEVTAAVHKSGNQALCLAVRHHSIELGLKEVDDLVVELYRSLIHNDRAVRLSAGSVFAFDRIYLLLTTSWVNQPSPRGDHVILQSGRTSFMDSRGGDL
jgi:hypothetical protein